VPAMTLRVVAIVPARNEENRIADTVGALRRLPGVTDVVVADDGSTDATADRALISGARVLRTPRRIGKGAVMEGALRRAEPADVYVLADGDLGRSAGELGTLMALVVQGRTDMAVAVLPKPPTGGFGLVKAAARRLIQMISGRAPVEPLSGQRAVTSECLSACRPLSPGFGAEAGLFADALRMGFRVVEIPLELEHRFTRKDVGGFLHRGRQGWDALRALIPRLVRVR
jgi:glycosyltransferase involved in cell wall biosynthesis